MEKLKPEYTFTEELKAKVESILLQLKQETPEAFEDGQINFDILKDLIGLEAIDDETPEHFGLNWPGKRQARRLAAIPPKGTLKPCIGEGINEDTTENIFIEGENLEVLKILRKSYRGKIKMIYIDPPYNTGNDFIYKDDFSEPLEDYLRKSGQKSDEGLLTSNPKSQGRFHSNWLNFMYPRLRLAKDLLSEDGLIFVSIDNNEVYNLKALLEELYGSENFIAELIWQKKTGSSDAINIATITESILVFSKQITTLKINQDYDAHDEERFKYKDEYFDERGPFYYDNLDRGTLGYQKSLDYGVMAPDGKMVFPNGRLEQYNDGWRWKWGKEKLEWGLKNGFIEVLESPKKESGWGVYYKIYLNVDNDGNKIVRSSPYKNLIQGILNTHASNESKELFGTTVIFSNPKPINLIKKLLKIGTSPKDLIMDFFSGSGTTGHAVFDLNSEDDGDRKFICIQIPEIIEENTDAFKAGFKYISDITKKRLRRAISIIDKTNKNKKFGFKAFRLDRSNIKEWQDVQPQINRGNNLFTQLEQQNQHPIHESTSPLDLITEFMLVEGFPLHSKISKLEGINGNTIFKIVDSEIPYTLFICLDDNIHADSIGKLPITSKDTFICLDRSFNGNDQVKMQLDDICKLKTV